MAENESAEINWDAPEFEYRHKDVSWYWMSIIVAAVLIGFAVWQKNFLFGFFAVVSEILILTWANQEPTSFRFTLTDKGLRIGEKKFYAYKDMETFCCHKKEGSTFETISFKFNKRLRRPLQIIVPQDTLEKVQPLLAEYVPEVEYETSLIDSIEEFIGF